MYIPAFKSDTFKRPFTTVVSITTCFPSMSNTLVWIAPNPVEVIFTKPLFDGLGYNLNESEIKSALDSVVGVTSE